MRVRVYHAICMNNFPRLSPYAMIGVVQRRNECVHGYWPMETLREFVAPSPEETANQHQA
jgi:hypothetical protein